MWHEIIEQSDIDNLLKLFSHFQDSCLRDVYLSTREFVDEKFDLHFSNKTSAILLFQREFGNHKVLELKFEDVTHFNFLPFDENSKTAIYEANILLSNGLFYWADTSDWKIGDNKSIWISGKKLFWRLRPELIGNVKRINID